MKKSSAEEKAKQVDILLVHMEGSLRMLMVQLTEKVSNGCELNAYKQRGR